MRGTLAAAILLAVALQASGAMALCLPEDVGDLGLQTRLAPSPEPAVPKALQGAFVFDASLGMAGFVRDNERGQGEPLFRKVVLAAWEAFSKVKGRALAGETGGFVLWKDDLYENGDWNRILETCTAKFSSSSSNPRTCARTSYPRETSVFLNDANLKGFLTSLATGKSISLKTANGSRTTTIDPQRDLVVFVTDLQNQTPKRGATELGQRLVEVAEKEGVSVVVAPFRSPFHGRIYDLPTGESHKDQFGALQPFFVIAMGPASSVSTFERSFRREARLQGVTGAGAQTSQVRRPLSVPAVPPLPDWSHRDRLEPLEGSLAAGLEWDTVPLADGGSLPRLRISRDRLKSLAFNDDSLVRLSVSTLSDRAAGVEQRFCWRRAGMGETGPAVCPLDDGSPVQTWTGELRPSVWMVQPPVPGPIHWAERAYAFVFDEDNPAGCGSVGKQDWQRATAPIEASLLLEAESDVAARIKLQPIDPAAWESAGGVLQPKDLFFISLRLTLDTVREDRDDSWLDSRAGWSFSASAAAPADKGLGVGVLNGFVAQLKGTNPSDPLPGFIAHHGLLIEILE
ncbi:MAG: hypothetical protein Kilf2KO_20500 [Rhodospirillales bacterium]